jgi:F-type H+-transporting ATPase subunit delta
VSALEKQSVQGLSKRAGPHPGLVRASENWDQVADRTSLVSGVSERYATALFELANEAGELDAAEADLKRFAGLIEDSGDLKRLVRSPVFSADEQYRAVAAVLEKAEIGGLVANLIKVAAKNRRLFAVPDMITAFGRLMARHRGEVSAEVTSAEPLSDKHLADLKSALKVSLGKDVALEANVDPSLIGGLIVKVGSRMIDGSLRTKLNSLKLVMKEVG